jgi:hypothetical protein
MESREEEPGVLRSSNLSVSAAQPDCLLTVGSQRLPALLADECGTSLHVLVQRSPSFWVDDAGVLQTSDAEIAVRVLNIVRLDPDEDVYTSYTEGFRIGLMRLNPAAAKLQLQPMPVREARPKLLALLPWNRIRISAAGVFGFAMIMTPLVLVAVVWRHHLHQANSVEAATAVANTLD